MRLPDPVAYHAALQHPETAFADPELRTAKVTTGALGLPRAVAGNFAVTYQLTAGNYRSAVRCFHRDAADRAQRYAAITQTLRDVADDIFVQIAYLATGVRIGQTWYPITTMPWVDGLTLNRAIEQRLAHAAGVHEIEQRFVRLVDKLGRLGIAHGDLQHGNVLVEPSGALRLVDYDGMFVPALRGLRASEVGDPNYQHPARHDQFDAELDRFSALVIVVALRALAAEPALWRTYNTDDNLLFRRADFLAPAHSALFRDLRALPAVSELAARLAHVCQRDYARVPRLAEFLGSAAPSPAPIPPLHVSILNRLYGLAPPPVASSARSATPPASRAPRSWKLRRALPQQALAFTADGALLVTADKGGRIRLRDVLSGRTRYTWTLPGGVIGLACTPDGQHVVALGRDGTLSHWRLPSARSPVRSAALAATATQLACGPNGAVVVASGGSDVQVWDATRGRRTLAWRGSVSSTALSSDGTRVAAGSGHGALRCWAVSTGKLLAAAGQVGPVGALAISPDGARLASSGPGPEILLWSLPGGRALDRLPTPERPVHLVFSGDSHLLAAALPGGACVVWNLHSRQIVLEKAGSGETLTALAFSSDGRNLAAIGADGLIWLRVLEPGAPRRLGARVPKRRQGSAKPVSITPREWMRNLLRRVAAVH
jgi:WD40 repeat protein